MGVLILSGEIREGSWISSQNTGIECLCGIIQKNVYSRKLTRKLVKVGL